MRSITRSLAAIAVLFCMGVALTAGVVEASGFTGTSRLPHALPYATPDPEAPQPGQHPWFVSRAGRL